MTDRVLFDRDPLSGVTEYFHEEPDGGFTIESQQDLTGLLEQTKYLRNENTGRMGDLVHVASIPNVILMGLVKQGILTYAGRILDDKRYRAWLNDADNQAFRTRRCRV